MNWGRRLFHPVLLALLVGLALRLWFVTAVHPPAAFDYSDMHAYIARARIMADPSAASSPYDWFYPSGTSAFLSLFLQGFGRHGLLIAGIAQALLGGLEIVLVYVAVRRFVDHGSGVVAACLFAVHYLAISYAGFFLSENVLTLGLVSACALLVPGDARRCAGAGLAVGLGAWAKSQLFLLAPLWAVLLWRSGERRSAVALVAATLAVVVPVSIVCSARSGHFAFISTNGGETFALAQCPVSRIEYRDPQSHTAGAFGLPVLVQRAERGEIEGRWAVARYEVPFIDSGYYLRRGVECIRDNPRHTTRMLAMHLVDTFAGPPWSNVVPWPDSHTRFRNWALGSNLFVAYAVAPLAFWTLWKRRRERGVWFLFGLPIASLLASAVLFHGDPRYRVPYDFAFFALAAPVLIGWTKRAFAWRKA